MKNRNVQLAALIASATLLMAGPATAQPEKAPAEQMVALSEVPSQAFAGSGSKQMLKAQVLLDRARFSPGVIDGYAGSNTSRAIRAFERAKGLEADGKLDAAVMQRLEASASGQVLKRYRISDDDVDGPFIDQVPDALAKQAKLDRLAYVGPAELLAEKFHMSQDLLKALNPDADFSQSGTEIVVAASGDDSISGQVARIEVDKSASAVRAFDGSGKLLASYPATVGSKELPSPSGSMEVKAVASEATYHFDPEKNDWGPDKALTIAAGPNNPVGGVWIDLTKDGYGIHGSPEPALIGKTASHGCVRLTNWDAQELAGAVEPGVKVVFTGES